MSNFNCCSRNRGVECTFIAIAISVIVGIVTTLLTITGAITLSPLFTGIVLGVALVYLLVNLFVAATFRCCRTRECTDTPLSLILIGIIGAILTAVILLAVDFAATSIIGAIITGLLLLFSSLFIISTACLVKCLADTDTFQDNM